MSTLVEQLEQLHREAASALESATTLSASETWYSDYLGRKGQMTAILRGLGQLPQDERPVVGQTANRIKNELEAALKQRQAAIEQAEMEQALAAEGIDVTMPGRKPVIGGLHPTTTAMREIVDIFALMGFEVYDSPEVETDDLNFGLLNFPPDHPAREMQDTFFTTRKDVILRTHTSPGQIRCMREYAPHPIRVVLPGKVFGTEEVAGRWGGRSGVGRVAASDRCVVGGTAEVAGGSSSEDPSGA